MSKKDIQKQFDYAVRQVIKQGRPAYSVEDGCRYRLKKGNTILKCPVGWLIPDSYFKANPDDIADTGISELNPSVYSYARMAPFQKDQDILRDLQGAHDDAAKRCISDAAFVNEFKDGAKEIANSCNLKWNFE